MPRLRTTSDRCCQATEPFAAVIVEWHAGRQAQIIGTSRMPSINQRKARGYAGLSVFWCYSVPAGTSRCQTRDHSHSVINGSRKFAWLKGFSMIEMGLTVAFTVCIGHLFLAREMGRFAG